MSHNESRETILDATVHAEEKGEFLRVLGECILLMAGLTSIWIWVGWRAGTWFWFWWTSGLATLGMSLVTAGILLRERAARGYAAGSGRPRARLASRSGTEGELSPADPERRAA